ncbi:Serine protease, subtilisin family [Amycolatopsis marina]|uniref:Serine protease, subtilisin family n=1 Tax=Amycolatopsis marina TaxID=490629 RepID=A0A1I1ASV8_9PSEU|nr:S8 family serine peptidase [Amycolatopsis marina]SFB40612.1 Serine protease, subtilisin family [Amycolatopsis marina]
MSATVCAFAPQQAIAQQCVPVGDRLAPVPWAQNMLAPDKVWPLSTGAGQRVAVVATGVADTPFLASALIGNTDVAPMDENRQDSGRVDCLGIGTGVAGTVAGQPVQGAGFRGLAPGARILSAKAVGDAYPTGRQPPNSVAPGTLATAIDWSIDQNATIIVVASITYEDSEQLRAAVRRAVDSDAVVIAAVGEANQNEPTGATPYPAAYEGVLGVGAIGQEGTVAQESRAEHVDLVAPGANIVTTYPRDGLGSASGTAFAAGYVGGAAALVRAYRPNRSAASVVHQLLATATPAPEGVGSARYGHGIVNPYLATLNRTVDGNPVQLPTMTPAVVTAEELARQQSWAASSSLAFTLAGAALTVAGLLTGIAVFGPRGRRRRWRSGFAPVPAAPSDTVSPSPPGGLFDDKRR